MAWRLRLPLLLLHALALTLLVMLMLLRALPRLKATDTEVQQAVEKLEPEKTREMSVALLQPKSNVSGPAATMETVPVSVREETNVGLNVHAHLICKCVLQLCHPVVCCYRGAAKLSLEADIEGCGSVQFRLRENEIRDEACTDKR